MKLPSFATFLSLQCLCLIFPTSVPLCRSADAGASGGTNKVLILGYLAQGDVAKRIDNGVKAWNRSHPTFRDVRNYTGDSLKMPERGEIVVTVKVEYVKPGSAIAILWPFAGAKQILVTGQMQDKSGRTSQFEIKRDSRLGLGGPPVRGDVEERIGSEVAARAAKFASGN